MKKIIYSLFILIILKAFPSMAIDGFIKEDLGWKAKKFISKYVNNSKVYEIKDDKLYLKSQNETLEEIGKFTGEKSAVCHAYVGAFLKSKYTSLSNFEGLDPFNSIELFIGDFMEEVEEPQKEDIVTYYGYGGAYNNDWRLNHVGIMASHNIVRAKWGECLGGKVLEHKLETVVSGYGPYLKFYRLKDEFKDINIDAYKKYFEEEISRFFSLLYEQLFFKFSLLNTLKSHYNEYGHKHKQETINRIKYDLLNAKKEINDVVNNHINKDEKKVKFIGEPSFTTPVSKIHHKIIHDITSNWLDNKNASEIHNFAGAFLLNIINKSFNNKQVSSFTNRDTDSMINEIIDTDSVINQINEKMESEKKKQIEFYKAKIADHIFSKIKIYQELIELFKDNPSVDLLVKIKSSLINKLSSNELSSIFTEIFQLYPEQKLEDLLPSQSDTTKHCPLKRHFIILFYSFHPLHIDFEKDGKIIEFEPPNRLLIIKCMKEISDFVDSLDKAPESEEARNKALEVLGSSGVSCLKIKKFFEDLDNKDKDTNVSHEI
jgi:hypothetical protein